MSYGSIYDSTWWGNTGEANGWGNVYPISSASTLLDGLVHYWSFDESSGNAIDQVGSGDITFSGSTVNQGSPSALLGNQVILVNAADQGSFTSEATGGNYTIFAWVKATVAGSLDYIFDFLGTERTIMAYHSNTANTFGWFDGGWNSFGDNTPYRDGDYHLLVMTLDATAGEVKFYADNAQIGSTDTGYTSRNLLGNTNLGSNLSAALASAGVYNRVLTADELTELYGSGLGKAYPFSETNTAPNITDNLSVSYDFDESSGNLLDKVGSTNGVVNGALQSQTGLLGNCYYFDGVNDYIDLTGISINSGDLSFEFWIKTDQTGNAKYLFESQTGRIIIAFHEFSSTQWGIYDGNWVKFRTNTENNDIWHHVVMVANYGAREHRLYIDGVLDTTITSSTNLNAIGGTTAIGANSNGSAQYWKGYMNIFRVWRRTLSASEVSHLYNSGVGRLYSELGGT